MSKMQYRSEGGIARVTLDDGKMNVINWDFVNELNASMDRALSDQSKALIITSGRPGVFSAGLDLKLLSSLEFAPLMKFTKQFARTMLRILLFPLPTIAAYRGHAIAGGIVISCACDRWIVQDGPFRMQMNEMINGMMIPRWIALICQSTIPHRWWREVLLQARAYTPREAYERNIPDTLVEESGDVMKVAEAVAQEMSKVSGPAYGATKKILFQEEADRAMEVFDRDALEWRIYSKP